jgi:hypothetical protein
MAWRSNIPQKSFLCERLFIPSEEWFVFYMQMTISTTAVACCAFCALFMCYQKCLNFAVLKVLPSGDWWVLSAVSVEILQILFLKWISVLSSICLFGGAPDRSVMMLLSDFDWCVQWLGSIRFLFLRWSCFWGGVSDTVNRLL